MFPKMGEKHALLHVCVENKMLMQPMKEALLCKMYPQHKMDGDHLNSVYIFRHFYFFCAAYMSDGNLSCTPVYHHGCVFVPVCPTGLKIILIFSC